MLIRIEDVPWIEKNFPNITMINLGKGTHFLQEDHPHQIGIEGALVLAALIYSCFPLTANNPLNLCPYCN